MIASTFKLKTYISRFQRFEPKKVIHKLLFLFFPIFHADYSLLMVDPSLLFSLLLDTSTPMLYFPLNLLPHFLWGQEERTKRYIREIAGPNIAVFTSKQNLHQNEHVFACVMYGTRVSFFIMYDLEQADPHYKDLVPMYPPAMKKKATWRWHVQEDGTIFGCEFDLLDEKCQPFVHACFIEMSRSTGPIDPRDT